MPKTVSINNHCHLKIGNNTYKIQISSKGLTRDIDGTSKTDIKIAQAVAATFEQFTLSKFNIKKGLDPEKFQIITKYEKQKISNVFIKYGDKPKEDITPLKLDKKIGYWKNWCETSPKIQKIKDVFREILSFKDRKAESNKINNKKLIIKQNTNDTNIVKKIKDHRTIKLINNKSTFQKPKFKTFNVKVNFPEPKNLQKEEEIEIIKNPKKNI